MPQAWRDDVSDRSSTRGAVWTGDGTDTVVAEATASDAGAALVAAAELVSALANHQYAPMTMANATLTAARAAVRRDAAPDGSGSLKSVSVATDDSLPKFVDPEQSARIGRRIGDRISRACRPETPFATAAPCARPHGGDSVE